MPAKSSPPTCGCCDGVSRRQFVRTAASAAALLPFGSVIEAADRPASKPPTKTSETLVTQLYQSLTEAQRKEICFGFDDPLRSKIDNNWHIVKPTVAGYFTPDQQALIRDIFHGLHSPEYAAQVMRQVEHDNGKAGFGGCSVALFGQPGTGKFEFVLTGRHVTRRCDGDSVEGAAFGGPIFYGHQAGTHFDEAPDHPGNIYWYQAKRANELFQALDGKQRKLALLDQARPERKSDTVKLTGKTSGLAGLPASELTRDQKTLLRQVMADVLAPFRKTDADEAMKLVEKGGFDHLHVSFYKGHDVGGDGVWDVWQVEGPAMLWYFRGDPHVHTWVHVRESA